MNLPDGSLLALDIEQRFIWEHRENFSFKREIYILESGKQLIKAVGVIM